MIESEYLQKSKMKILSKLPFFGSLLLRLPIVLSDDIDSYMGTNGKHIIVNAKMCEELTKQEINWALVHETLHVALLHLSRSKNKDTEIFNYACDYVIHSIMHEYINLNNADNIMKMPDGCLYDNKYDGMTSEEVYNLLYENNKNNKNNKDNEGNKETVLSKDGKLLNSHKNWKKSFENISPIEAEKWKGVLKSSFDILLSKNQGKISFGFERVFSEILNPKLDWKYLLNDFTQNEITDYSFMKYDIRFEDFFIPSFSEEEKNIKDLLIFIDSSGSISDKQINIFLTELLEITNSFNSIECKLGFFDSKLYKMYKLSTAEEITKIKSIGGGGTDCKECFNYAKNNKNDVSGIIIFTDGYLDFYNEKVSNGIPVLWIITSKDIEAPWGLSAYLEIP